MVAYLDGYVDYLNSAGQGYLADAVIDTADRVLTECILPGFDWGNGNKTGMLLGHVQSGKTSHVFGVIAKAADEGFNVFLLLTTDNVYLQSQTFKRAVECLDGFNVCDESDEVRFVTLARRKPTVIVLKKNAQVLASWQRRLAASELFPGNPVFIVDDEADASSLNTRVNNRDISTINSTLRKIRNLSKCGVYLQLTATPQALFLQTNISQWKPEFVELFKPGKGYIGGDFFFEEDQVPPSVILTNDQELQDLLNDDEFASNGLMQALMSFLISSAHLFEHDGCKVCNFVVHPSVRVRHHALIANKVGEYLNHLVLSFDESENMDMLREVYDNLLTTKPDLIDYSSAVDFIRNVLTSQQINIQVMNSKSHVKDYSSGINILIGGNSLGRGITFPKLQTIYYCRTARVPQADTVWQHCRMFGYDRDPGLVRAFIPPRLYRALSEINSVNNSIFSQVARNGVENTLVYYSSGIRPTRRQVIDQSSLSVIAGGVNYFPFKPQNSSISEIDNMLSPFGDQDHYEANLNLLISCLEKIKNDDPDEWSNVGFINCIKAYAADRPAEQGILIVRRNRDIAPDTGTMLSPNDRRLGQQFTDRIVLTVYKVTGSKGWDGQQLWIPNIKFPDSANFYDVRG